MRVQRIGDEYGVLLSAQVLAALNLAEGAEVELREVGANHESSRFPEHRYATVEEVMEAYRRTEPQHRETYRELAK